MKKKILFIIPYLLGGGALKTVSNLSKEFSKKYDITIVGIYGSEKKFDFTGKLIELNMSHQKNIFKKFRDFLYIKKAVKQIKVEGNFDFSISFLTIADFINVLTKSANGEKTWISIRNIESIEYKENFFRRWQTYLSAKKADHIISISKEVEDDMIDNFKVPSHKITTIYNPCILNGEVAVVEDSNFVSGKTAITLGGLKYQKGQWHLIRAFSKVIENIPEARLLIFGRGEYQEYLEKLIKDLRLEKNIKLMGYVIGPYNYVKKSDVFIFSSLFEGLGNAMMEALSCGIPVISTDYISGAREILAPDTEYRKKTLDSVDYCKYGVLVPNFDGKCYSANDPLTKQECIMASAIIEMLSNKKMNLKYRKMATQRSEDFEIKKIAEEWYNLLESEVDNV